MTGFECLVLYKNYYSIKPYFCLILSSFSSIGSEMSQIKMNVAAACTQSIGNPDYAELHSVKELKKTSFPFFA